MRSLHLLCAGTGEGLGVEFGAEDEKSGRTEFVVVVGDECARALNEGLGFLLEARGVRGRKGMKPQPSPA